MFHPAELATIGLSLSHNDDLLHALTAALLTKWQDPIAGQHPVSSGASPPSYSRTLSPGILPSHLRTCVQTYTAHLSLSSHVRVTCYYTWRTWRTCTGAKEEKTNIRYCSRCCLSRYAVSHPYVHATSRSHEHLVWPIGRYFALSSPGRPTWSLDNLFLTGFWV